MTGQPLITLLIQDRQHLRKMQSLLPFIPEGIDVHFLIDDLMMRTPRTLIANEKGNFVFLSDFLEKSYLSNQDGNWLSRIGGALVRLCASIGFIKSVVLRISLAIKAWKKKNGGFLLPLKLREFLKDTTPDLYMFLSETNILLRSSQWKRCEIALKDYTRRHNPSLLILAEGNVQYVSEVFIRIFHEAGAGAVIAPYTFCTPEEPANYYKDNFMFKALRYHEWFLKPHWFYTYQGKKMIRLPFLLALMYEKLGYTPPQPWILESSTADAILVESVAMKKHYLKQNIPTEQLSVVGDSAHDRIFAVSAARNGYRERFAKEHGIPSAHGNWLVFAVFPDLSNKFDSTYDFKTYHGALEAIITSVGKLTGWTTILSIHPSLDKKAFQHYASDTVKISDWPTTDLVPMCDLYLASISATIRWAIAAGIPVLNYDIYKFNYQDYIGVQGVLNVFNWADFEQALTRMTDDPAYLQNLAQAQAKHAADWGMIDGKFGERFKSLINSFVEQNHKKKAA